MRSNRPVWSSCTTISPVAVGSVAIEQCSQIEYGCSDGFHGSLCKSIIPLRWPMGSQQFDRKFRQRRENFPISFVVSTCPVDAVANMLQQQNSWRCIFAITVGQHIHTRTLLSHVFIHFFVNTSRQMIDYITRIVDDTQTTYCPQSGAIAAKI